MAHALLFFPPMSSKVVALLLAVLIVVPFTAPFSTCELTTLFATPDHRPSPTAPRSSVASATEVAITPAFFVSNTSGARVLPLCRAPLSPSEPPPSPMIVLSSLTATGGGQSHATARTILRV